MTALVEVDAISKSFGVKILDDLTLVVGDGDAVGIVGPNGAGKTTLLNMIAGDLRPDEGSIRFRGVDVTSQTPEARCRAGIGRTSQIPRPFEGMTVFENVLVGATFGVAQRGSEQDAVQRAAAALDRADMLHLANRQAGSLALLQRKRLELARALATEPEVLLLDEIAGGLTEAEVLELVETVRSIHGGGTTLVWIEHIVHALLAVVDRIVAISFGSKIAEGDPHEVMASDAVRDVYLGGPVG
ncbi:MAG: ATP-binding cassette domain-containing protein [Actinomycetota bacterium]